MTPASLTPARVPPRTPPGETEPPEASIRPGDRLVWTERDGSERTGTVVADPAWSGGLRVGGRSVSNILDECVTASAYAPSPRRVLPTAGFPTERTGGRSGGGE